MSAPDKFSEMFWEGIRHLEIGELPDSAALERFLQMCRREGAAFGIHSPLYRGGSKYDLLEPVALEPQQAWAQIETEARDMARAGAQYILVHFPYFTDAEIVGESRMAEAHRAIRGGLERLRRIQDKYGIPFVCEPKLGPQRSSAGIRILHHFPEHVWRQYELKLCIDLGDYLIAAGDQIHAYLAKWLDHVRIVHLHNVQWNGDKYIWIPVHPEHETDGVHYRIEEHIRYLSRNPSVTFVFEHTPHSNPSRERVREGCEWVKSLVGA